MKVYCGEGAGKRILDSIARARRRIYISSPYLSQEYLDVLVEKAKEGVEVKLITSEEWAKDVRVNIEDNLEKEGGGESFKDKGRWGC